MKLKDIKRSISNKGFTHIKYKDGSRIKTVTVSEWFAIINPRLVMEFYTLDDIGFIKVVGSRKHGFLIKQDSKNLFFDSKVKAE